MGANLYLHGVINSPAVKVALSQRCGMADALPAADWASGSFYSLLSMDGLTAWAAHHSSSKDITEQDKRKRTGCFSVNQSVPPLGCAVPLPCSPPGQQAAPPTRARSDQHSTNKLAAMIDSHLHKKPEMQESSAPASLLLPPCIPAEAQNRRAHYYNVVRALLVF